MRSLKLSLTAGLAMFAMFFGSGNLVFPLKIGAHAGQDYLGATLGFMATAVLVPFLGLFSMILFAGDKEKYFSLAGKYTPFIISALIICLIGPFGVIPRCILVSYGGFHLLYPQISLLYFSIFFLFLIFLIIYKKNQIVPLIGKYLGPIKICSISLIILSAVYKASPVLHNDNTINPFLLGLKEGYQTMDLLAAFFFSVTIVDYLKSVCSNKQETLKISIYASIIGAGLIALIYFGFIYLGAHYSHSLLASSPEKYLAIIAHNSLGKYATISVSFIIFISCLVTASSLTKIFADFLNQDISRGRINWLYAILITFIISLIFSLNGFNYIANLLAWVLHFIYPALIALASGAILNHFYQFKYTKHMFLLVLICSVINKIW